MKHIRDPGIKTCKAERISAVRAKAVDELRFLRTWLESPLKTGAVSPSGPELAACMASYLSPEPGKRVVELGPGTGAVTAAILQRGVAPADLKLVEFCPEFCDLLQKRFPGVGIRRGDAYDLQGVMAQEGILPLGLNGIVSSLPMLNRPEEARLELLKSALEFLAPGAPFIQFSYGLAPPIRMLPKGVTMSTSGWIWRNFPPARVFVYRRTVS
ncbi:class I SAM-dependent methyltransferase [Roseibium limicola]|uniref:Phospholipid methyltransferase n=1 Tax=Roseibium limicola TaxID=2816037 RepID=A0A939EQT2_9HYPH|nr:phospholipid methyltransferase [Roseibium limicola]MBO0346397.1 phospholipid methyltransferase [Roseibium limicola]